MGKNAPDRARTPQTQAPRNARARHTIQSAITVTRARRRAVTHIEERPARARTMPAPDSEFLGPRRSLASLTSTEGKGLLVVAMTGRESAQRGSFTTGERFQLQRRDPRGWTMIGFRAGQPTGRVCSGVPAMCLQILETP